MNNYRAKISNDTMISLHEFFGLGAFVILNEIPLVQKTFSCDFRNQEKILFKSLFSAHVMNWISSDFFQLIAHLSKTTHRNLSHHFVSIEMPKHKLS